MANRVIDMSRVNRELDRLIAAVERKAPVQNFTPLLMAIQAYGEANRKAGARTVTAAIEATIKTVRRKEREE